ncbi:helix-turn-helix domain-containing protein [Lachnospiraceae bacterium JLR.KK008]
MLTKQEMVNNFILNIEKERVKQNLTQAQMAKKLDMSLSGYKKMVSGVTTKIDLYTVYLLRNLTGKWVFELIDDYPEDSELVMKLQKLSLRQKNFIRGIIDFELEFANSHRDEPAEDYITVFVPTGNMEDGMIYDSSNYYKLNAAAYRKKFGNDLYCGIQVTSDHFHPVYNLGDVLLVCHKAIREGDTGIFLNKETGRAYIRKLHPSDTWILDPINGYGEPIIIDSHNINDTSKWIRFGYILTKIRE